MKATIHAQGNEITVLSQQAANDYLSLTDIARYKNPESPADVVKNWMRSRSTIEFLGLWEQLNNPDFELVEFDQFKNEAGSNAFVLSPQKWIRQTAAVGLASKSGRNGGTFAHKDIAFEFASWISPEFKLYIIKDYQRLKSEERDPHRLEWNLSRAISKINYKIHTDAVKDSLLPRELSQREQGMTYASEADLLNMALFGQTASEWRAENPQAKGNMRDHASIPQLIVLSNLESMNAELIKQKKEAMGRLEILNRMAIEQMQVTLAHASVKHLEVGDFK